jgi:RNA polymerase sigma-70 factor (ECF subfamily)
MNPEARSTTAGGADRDRDELQALCTRVFAAVRRACPPWLESHADDIVQNVLIQLLGKIRQGETKPAFNSMYLTKAAYGATVDEIRRVTRRRESDMPEENGIERVGTDRENPERRVQAERIGLGIQECLGRLAWPRRAAVTLWLQGCSVPEIAERRSWGFKRAHNLVYRGLANMRSCLESKGLAP